MARGDTAAPCMVRPVALPKRDCLPVLEAGERLVLTDCEMSRDAFVRDNDPKRTH